MSLRFVLAALCAISASFLPARADESQAGFERLTTDDGLEVGIWYPASGTPSHRRLGLFAQDVVTANPPTDRYPLVVLSHGTGGDFSSHVDTAVALARAGFVVAALTHPGDNWRDASRATEVEERPVALGRLVTWMLAEWPGRAAIDLERIGAFGFSAGGFTVLAAAGGRPDLTRLADHCAAHPTFFDCGLLRSHPQTSIEPWPQMRDVRIKAIVVAAPALGFAFDRAGLAAVRVPVQLWRADADEILPSPFYADAVRAALPVAPDFHAVPGAGHFDFLPPCADPSLAPPLCASGPGFDRAAFHVDFDAEVVAFFRATIGP